MNHSNTASGLARRFVWGAGLVVLLGSIGVVLHAFNPQPDPPGFYALIGFNQYETLRLHVANFGGTNGSPPDPCNVQISFVNLAGQIVKSSSVKLNPGQGTSLDLNFNEASPTAGLLAATPTRITVRPVFNTSPPDPCYTASSAEVFETSTGQSRVFAVPSVQYPAPVTATATTTVGQ